MDILLIAGLWQAYADYCAMEDGVMPFPGWGPQAQPAAAAAGGPRAHRQEDLAQDARMLREQSLERLTPVPA